MGGGPVDIRIGKRNVFFCTYFLLDLFWVKFVILIWGHISLFPDTAHDMVFEQQTRERRDCSEDATAGLAYCSTRTLVGTRLTL